MVAAQLVATGGSDTVLAFRAISAAARKGTSIAVRDAASIKKAIADGIAQLTTDGLNVASYASFNDAKMNQLSSELASFTEEVFAAEKTRGNVLDAIGVACGSNNPKCLQEADSALQDALSKADTAAVAAGGKEATVGERVAAYCKNSPAACVGITAAAGLITYAGVYLGVVLTEQERQCKKLCMPDVYPNPQAKDYHDPNVAPYNDPSMSGRVCTSSSGDCADFCNAKCMINAADIFSAVTSLAGGNTLWAWIMKYIWFIVIGIVVVIGGIFLITKL